MAAVLGQRLFLLHLRLYLVQVVLAVGMFLDWVVLVGCMTAPFQEPGKMLLDMAQEVAAPLVVEHLVVRVPMAS
jgi:hypothetical protein